MGFFRHVPDTNVGNIKNKLKLNNMKFTEIVKEFIGKNIQYTNKEIKKMLANEVGANFSILEIAEIKNTILTEIVNSLIVTAQKYNELEDKIAKCYVNDNGDMLSDEESEHIDLGTIGEISASHFGWL